LSDHPITRNVGDFRLLDREVVDEILKFRSPEPFLRGMISKLGYEESLVHYIRPKRKLGNSKFGFRELVTLGFRGVLNSSTIALKASILIGVIWILLAVVGTVSFISMKILSFPLPDGLVTLIVVNFVGFGINSLMLGTLGLYVSRITAIVSNEPMAIFSDRLNVRESLTKERGHEKYKL
jgi:dolichol-phosphate mannosyltransferase